MKSKTVERLMNDTPQHIKDQVDLFADNLVNKQTAIDWLEDQLKDNLKTIVLKQDYQLMEYLFAEARRMEQDQLSIKYGEGYHEGVFDKENK